MSEMVERVARALASSHGTNPDDTAMELMVFYRSGKQVRISFDADDAQPWPIWKLWEMRARAAIEAMREPTDEQINKGALAAWSNEPLPAWYFDILKRGYLAVIDAALK